MNLPQYPWKPKYMLKKMFAYIEKEVDKIINDIKLSDEKNYRRRIQNKVRKFIPCR